MALSPMMQHYVSTKENYKDALLLYRLGDFYELFFEDAIVASKALDLTLTGRDCGLPERAPMCGIPYHALDNYLPRLIEQGFKVAICEQLTQPTKGVKLVERDVVRVVTPGTVIDSGLLNEKENNYIASVYSEKNGIGVSFVDISSGVLHLTEIEGAQGVQELNDILTRVRPTEIISNQTAYFLCEELQAYKLGIIPKFNAVNDTYFNLDSAKEKLQQQLNKPISKIGYRNNLFAMKSVGALLTYLFETQKRALLHINAAEFLHNSKYMQLDANTRRNLEITETMKDRKRKGTILWLLDKTKTSMGARMLKTFVEQPLYDKKSIDERLNAVEEVVKSAYQKDAIINVIKDVSDIERLCGRISYGNFSPKDALALLRSLEILPQLKNKLSGFKTGLIKQIYNEIYDFSEIVKLLDGALVDNPPFNVRDGGVFKKGFNKELDGFLDISTTGKNWIAQLEASEREKTGIKNLKIGFNSVFGYYIEVLKSQIDLVPFNYVRKQTITNAERYITDELKQIENKVLHAEERRLALEAELFAKLRDYLLENITAMQITARAIAVLDALLSLAQVAIENNYVKPKMVNNESIIDIKNGRHPVVEKLLKNEDFVPNDTLLDGGENKTMIITGPNMSGKSTYMRQVAVIVLMAHIGSFVPCSSATISLTDKIFTRVGASDDLAFGQSTFMVEMLEVSNILNNATQNSLIILDEVGRGTSTFDGLSIAWSVMEYLSKHFEAKTLFATHYHELTELEGILPGVKNYRINVKEFNGHIIFLRKIVRGGASRSFGIEVAGLAGLPSAVITRAKEILNSLEENEINKSASLKTVNDSAANDKRNRQNQEIANIISEININTLTPLNAFEILVDLINKNK